MNKEKILEVINKDAKVKNRYITPKGSTCAIGGLLQAAGFDVSRLEPYNTMSVVALMTRADVGPEISQVLKEHYDISWVQAQDIQIANDKRDKPSTRRDAIRRYLETGVVV